ncbi:uncharacterized protein LOC114536852 [Dendronephthya gigantea]|uniref:uncharacterized protein LOC114536852 n=1 Tax=Dendronephthya gigantea TaxID=151771 RepID=UPI00106D74B1|nr:uncharacterized protein LOC114536852 [Dendronephthya gigantea]
MTQLQMHLDGQAKLLVQGLGCDGKAYAVALKWLKKRFGHPVIVARAVIEKAVIDRIPPGNRYALSQFHNELRNCIFTLERMNFFSDLFSSNNLRMAIARLPPGLRRSWAKTSRTIRIQEMPNLIHFEIWMNQEVETAYDPDLPVDDKSTRRTDTKAPEIPSTRIRTFATSFPDEDHDCTSPTRVETPCLLCPLKHYLGRCWKYQNKSASEKHVFVRTKGLCYNCLRPGHHANKCSSKFVCRVLNCNKKHHSSLHDSPQMMQVRGTKTKSVGVNTEDDNKEKPVVASTHLKTDEGEQILKNTKVFVQMVPVKVQNAQGEEVNTFALLDPCSEATLIREDLANKLGLEGPMKSLSIGTVVSNGECCSSRLVDFTISPAASAIPFTEIRVDQAWTVPHLNVPSRHQRVSPNGAAFSYLDGLDFPNVSSCDIALLIGANIPEALIALEVRRGPENQPLAIRTALGWTLLGSKAEFKERNEHFTAANVNFVSISDENLHRRVEEFWRTESFGCSFEGKIPQSMEDQNAIRTLEATTKYTGERYEVGMLWRCENPVLPYNRVLAETSFRNLEKKFQKDPELATAYTNIIHGYLEKGYARKLSSDETKSKPEKVWYLPHHSVQAKHKKLRVVFNAAAKFRGTSLNDQLVTGPDLLNNLVGILTRFRSEKVAMLADIEAMFHQVKVKEDDQTSLRFLWRNVSTPGQPIESYQMQVHIFGAKSSPCCASYALRRTATDNASSFDNVVIQTVLRNFYMDDLLKSVPTIDEAIRLAYQLMDLLRRGGFRLTKWLSNCREVIQALPKTELATSVVDLASEELPMGRTLGVAWDIEGDQFKFNVSSVDGATKRHILKVTSSIFDPLGLLAPFIFKAKCLLQELWRLKLDWDEEITGDVLQAWTTWKTELEELKKFFYPRCLKLYPDEQVSVCQMHVFADASELGFAAVIYLRYIYVSSKISCAFLVGKSRVPPLKPLTVPRLELQAAVLATRLSTSIQKELNVSVHENFYWIDSLVVLQYIMSENRRFPTFIANRVSEIRENSKLQEWHHVSGALNPADDGSRGLSPVQLSKQHRWLSGPDFLWQSEEHWPIQPDFKQSTQTNCGMENECPIIAVIKATSPIIDPTEFSKLFRLLRVTSWVKRFLAKLQ